MQENADVYAVLARYYDLENADFVEDLAAYSELASQQGGAVLDIGCGTGRVTFYLARAGFQVVGVDPSAAMLDRARRKLEKQSFGAGQARLIQDDVANLDLDEQFALAIFAYHGFMHLTDRESQLRVLRAARRLLQAGGLLALDLPNPLEAFAGPDDPALVLERTFTDPDTGDTVMQQSIASMDRAAQLLSVTWIYDSIAADGTLKRALAPLVLRYTLPAEMDLLLEMSGFRLRAIYGDYDFEPYGEAAPRMFVVAEAVAS